MSFLTDFWKELSNDGKVVCASLVNGFLFVWIAALFFWLNLETFGWAAVFTIIISLFIAFAASDINL